jgi:hypothetical protein
MIPGSQWDRADRIVFSRSLVGPATAELASS